MVINTEIRMYIKSFPPKYSEKGMAAHIIKPSIINNKPMIFAIALKCIMDTCAK